jgi:hypothetical protein
MLFMIIESVSLDVNCYMDLAKKHFVNIGYRRLPRVTNNVKVPDFREAGLSVRPIGQCLRLVFTSASFTAELLHRADSPSKGKVWGH